MSSRRALRLLCCAVAALSQTSLDVFIVGVVAMIAMGEGASGEEGCAEHSGEEKLHDGAAGEDGV